MNQIDYQNHMHNIILAWFDHENKIISLDKYLEIIRENAVDVSLKEAYENEVNRRSK